MHINHPVEPHTESNMKGRYPLLITWVLLSFILCACSFKQPIETAPAQPTGLPSQTQDVTSPAAYPRPTEEPLPHVELTPAEKAEKLMNTLTLEEKIGQMFIIASRQDSEGKPQRSMDDRLKMILGQIKPGGFIFFSENLESIDQTVSFINSLQESSSIPMFMTIDEEGGLVSRLNKAPQLHSTTMPVPYDIGRTHNPAYAYEAAYAISEEIKSLGFNLNFAPVADIFTNPKNTVIGKRAYASEPNLASQMVEQAVKGALDCGIIPVVKHFPGHGDTSQDSHTGSAVVERTLEQLKAYEWMPFKAGIDAGAGMVMTAHVLTPQITDNQLPATLSKPILDYLRKDLGFDGVIITDGLEMNAISAYFPEEEAVVLAVEAGVDILLLPNDISKAYTAILNAVHNGRLTEERIDESVKRILSLKYQWIMDAPDHDLDPEKTLGSEAHRALADKIRKDILP